MLASRWRLVAATAAANGREEEAAAGRVSWGWWVAATPDACQRLPMTLPPPRLPPLAVAAHYHQGRPPRGRRRRSMS